MIKEQDGLYSVRVSKMIGGKQVFRKRGNIRTKGEARAAERDLLEELTRESNRVLTGKLWSDAVVDRLAAIENVVTPSTYYSVKTVLESHTGAWAGKYLHEITAIDVRALIEAEYAGKQETSKAVFAKYLRGVFKTAIANGATTVNPAALISFKKPKQNKLTAMSRPDVVRLLDHARRTEHPWYPVFLVTYSLGLRSGEAIALRWSDVDFENCTVRISQSWCSKGKIYKTPKNGRSRTIPLNSELVTFLRSRRAEVGETSEFVLPQFDDWKHGKAARVLNELQATLGIKKSNFHSLRASFITHLLIKGVSIVKVQEMVGHTDLKTTENYVRLCGSDLQGATDALALNLG